MILATKRVSSSTHVLTGYLLAWREGDPDALAQLMPLIYQELHRVAKRHMRRERGGDHRGQTLQTSALVNEAYLRLIDANQVSWQNRAHFLAIAANIMRRILVDAARRRHFAKRGGEQRQIVLEEAEMVSLPRSKGLVELDDALTALANFDARKARVVELRFFGGLSVEEIAQVLGVSEGTVLRDWRLSKSWLARELA